MTDSPRLRYRRQGRPSVVKDAESIGLVLVKKYWTVLRVGCVVLWIRLLLRLNSLPVILQQLHHQSATRDRDDVTMKALVGYVDRWLQLFPYNKRGNCFPRSLVIYRFARQLGYPVVFHCGVRKTASTLSGHAWLTMGPHTFYESGTQWQYFTVTFSFPPHPTRGTNQTTAI
jgi:hypothetical protein